MPIDDSFLDELRLMFMKGATPSCLMAQIASRHNGQGPLAAHIQHVFHCAFHVGPIRLSRKLDWSQLDVDACESLNLWLIPKMIELFPTWGGHLPAAEEPFWKEIKTKDAAQLSKGVAPETIPELTNSWDAIDSEARRYIIRILANLDEVYENSQILARLAERLQRNSQPVEPAATKE